MDEQTIDQLSRAELERHKWFLRYADRQRLEDGEFETVAERLLRGQTVMMWICGSLAVLLAMGGGWPWAIFVSAGTAFEYSHARRTHRTIHRWQRLLREQRAPEQRPDAARKAPAGTESWRSASRLMKNPR